MLPSEVHDIPSSKIKQISAGSRHTMLLEENGDLWFAGRCEMSGVGSVNLCKFTQLQLSWKSKYIACGWDVSASISEDNRLFVWGTNSSNQLGFVERKIIRDPTQLLLPDNEIPIEVKFGLKFTAILTQSRKLFVTGNLRSLLKSPSKHFKIITNNSLQWLQTDNTITGDITHFACGENHILLVTNDGHMIHGIGDNKYGQCGSGCIESSEKIIQIESGWKHSAYLTETKKLFLIGRNNYGQLGNGNRNEIASDIPHQCSIFPVNDFSLGAEHGILKSLNESVYTWGWNEHRNCGVDSDDDV